MQKREDLGKLAETLEGIPVWGCLPGSVAQAAGIQYGDVVMSVNGQRTRDLDDYLSARELRSDGADVVIFRNGVEQTLSLIFRRDHEAPDRLVQRIVEHVVSARIIPESNDGQGSEPPVSN